MLLAGAIPVEGASIIAREMRERLLYDGWLPTDLDKAANYLFEPGISVLKPALLAAQAGLVTAMHDPTEGGLATGIAELALAAGVGMAIDLDRVPVSELSRRLCAVFDLDPFGTLASGALLATAALQDVDALLQLWAEAGWPAAVIGRVLAPGERLYARRHGQLEPFPTFAVDEITRLWQ